MFNIYLCNCNCEEVHIDVDKMDYTYNPTNSNPTSTFLLSEVSTLNIYIYDLRHLYTNYLHQRSMHTVTRLRSRCVGRSRMLIDKVQTQMKYKYSVNLTFNVQTITYIYIFTPSSLSTACCPLKVVKRISSQIFK